MRQGYPFSPLLVNIVLEVIAKTKNTKGEGGREKAGIQMEYGVQLRADAMSLSVEYYRLHKKLLELINEFSNLERYKNT